MAARAAEARHRPGIHDLHVGAREEDEAELGPFPLALGHATAHQPVAERASAGEGPAAGDLEVARHRHRAPTRREHATHGHPGRAVHLAGRILFEVGRHQAAGGGHGKAPACAGVGLRERLHGLHEGERRRLGPAQRLRHAQPEEIAGAERVHHLGRQATLALAVLGVRSGYRGRFGDRHRAITGTPECSERGAPPLRHAFTSTPRLYYSVSWTRRWSWGSSTPPPTPSATGAASWTPTPPWSSADGSWAREPGCWTWAASRRDRDRSRCPATRSCGACCRWSSGWPRRECESRSTPPRLTVARAALAAGAAIVNDVSAFRFEPELAGLVADAGAGCCLVHMRGEPRTMQRDPRYEDVVAEVRAFLEERLAFAVAEGVPEEGIWLDPGIGFGKKLEHNLELLRRLDEIVAIGRPVVVGTSRKSFLGKLAGGRSAGRAAAGHDRHERARARARGQRVPRSRRGSRRGCARGGRCYGAADDLGAGADRAGRRLRGHR